MMPMYLLRVWFSLSDEVVDAIYDSYAMRKFMGLDFAVEQMLERHHAAGVPASDGEARTGVRSRSRRRRRCSISGAGSSAAGQLWTPRSSPRR